MSDKISGKVILAGAGPGDAELITVKLQKRLAEADVIITDRLVNPLIIEEHARKDAEVIIAGKQGYSDNSISQECLKAKAFLEIKERIEKGSKEDAKQLKKNTKPMCFD